MLTYPTLPNLKKYFSFIKREDECLHISNPFLKDFAKDRQTILLYLPIQDLSHSQNDMSLGKLSFVPVIQI